MLATLPEAQNQRACLPVGREAVRTPDSRVLWSLSIAAVSEYSEHCLSWRPAGRFFRRYF